MNAFAAYIATVVSIVTDRFESRDRGATAVEYGLLVGLIAVVIIATVTLLGGQLNGLFGTVSNALPAAP
jgi:pilus assembly protein Flp/PilA